jgi:hypothetical protein
MLVGMGSTAFSTRTSEVPSGRLYRVFEGDAPMPFRRFFELLASDEAFTDWFCCTLADFGGAAFYWELPPLTTATIDRDAEFVLIEAPSLARFPAERAPFAEHFARAPGEDVIAFPNLGGDALMVVPCPRGPDEHYSHLAVVLRNAPKHQVRALWRRTAAEMLRHIGDRPTWLSTAGGGVAWLHVRLDSRPKYYSHAPYRRSGS